MIYIYINCNWVDTRWEWVQAVAQLVEALHYNPAGRGFDSRLCHWDFSLTYLSGRTMALGLAQPLREISTRNISYGKGGRCVRLTNLPPSCADCLEIWEPQPPGTPWASPGLSWDCFAFYLYPVAVVQYTFTVQYSRVQ